MKKLFHISLLAAFALTGCSNNQEPTAHRNTSLANPEVLTSDPVAPTKPQPVTVEPGKVLATVNNRAITTDMVLGPLTEAYGLQFVLYLAQLELAKEQARKMNVTVTEADISAERQRTLETTFKDSIDTDNLKMTDAEKKAYRQEKYEELMEKLLENKRISQPEFRLAIETGAYLRKVADKQVQGLIKEEHIQEAFKIKYGEKARVKHIELANVREAADARRRIEIEKQPFEQVAQEMSRDQSSRAQGGAIRPFSRAEKLWPAAFIEASFALQKPGDMNWMVSSGDAIHIIRLEEKISPQIVKYEDYRDSLREELYNIAANIQVKRLREEIALEAGEKLNVEDPTLRRQYNERKSRASGGSARDMNPNAIRGDINSERPKASSTQPAPKPEDLRPPATRPGN